MDIYTSYFSNMSKLPKNYINISICLNAPKWYNGIQYKVLAPKFWWFIKWKRGDYITEKDLKEHALEHLDFLINKKLDYNDYEVIYRETVLKYLNANDVVNSLYELSGGKNIVLLCYENPLDFCHRHIVAKWLIEHGYKIIEWGYKNDK